jgi:hypothetical protein
MIGVYKYVDNRKMLCVGRLMEESIENKYKQIIGQEEQQ